MNTLRNLILYGNSVFMAEVEKGLQILPGVDIIHVEGSLDAALAHCKEISPDIVLVDLTSFEMEETMQFLVRNPGIPLIGINLVKNQMISINSLEYPSSSYEDLARIILTVKATAAPTRTD